MKYEVKNVCKAYDKLQVLCGISVEFKREEVTCILGPSGAGKTTLLNIITGSLNADCGEVLGFETDKMSFVFQEDRLIEWKTVEENLHFVLKDKVGKREMGQEVEKYLEKTELLEYKKYYPNKLSGGMRQRASIARAFAHKSDLLILDEPFKSLDISSKHRIIKCFQNIIAKEKRTCILVTHDIEEAVLLGDTIILLSEKPTSIKKIIKNTVPVEERISQHKEIIELKEYIIKNF